MKSPDFFTKEGVPGEITKRPDNIEELMEKTKREEGAAAAELLKNISPREEKKKAA